MITGQAKKKRMSLYSFTLLLLTLMMFAVTATTSFAIGNEIVTVNIPLKYVIKNAGKDSGKVKTTFTLEAKDDYTPMPEGANGRTKSVTMKGSGLTSFGDITYDVPDVYQYTVTKTTENVKNLKDFKEDRAKFTVDVCVLSDGTAHMIIKKVGEDGKSELIYDDSFERNAAKTGDEQNLFGYMSIFFAAMAALIVMLAIKERRDRNRRWQNEAERLR